MKITGRIPPTDNENGLTLVELLIAVAIIAIVAAVVVPNYIRQQSSRDLNTTGREIYANLQMTKVEAMRRNANVVMSFGNVVAGVFVPGSPFTSYRVFVDNGAGGGVSGDRILNGAEQVLVLTTALPQDILGTQNFGATNAVGFSSRILPTGIGTVTLNIDADGDGVADLIGGQTVFRSITVTIAGAVRYDDDAGVR